MTEDTKCVRVELESSDGTIRRLVGEEATKWDEMTSVMSTLSFARGSLPNYNELDWQVYVKQSGPASYVSSERTAKVVEREYRSLVEELVQGLYDVRNVLGQFKQDTSNGAIAANAAVKAFPFKELEDKIYRLTQKGCDMANIMGGWDSTRGWHV